MLAIKGDHCAIGKFYDTAASLLPIRSVKMNSKEVYFQKPVTSSKKLQITTSYYCFRKIALFTWVTVFILFNVQQCQIDLKAHSKV